MWSRDDVRATRKLDYLLVRLVARERETSVFRSSLHLNNVLIARHIKSRQQNPICLTAIGFINHKLNKETSGPTL
jgi:hypothetical protein